MDVRRQNEEGPLLKVSNLRIGFSGVEAVRGVSLEIARGETLGLVGESGSGKSATSLALMRLLPASAEVTGSVQLYGEWVEGGAARRGEAGRGEANTGVSPLRRKERASGRDDKVLGRVDQRASGRDDSVLGRGDQSVGGGADDGFEARQELLTLPEREMRARRGKTMAMIFQEPMTALNPVMTVGKQIAEAVIVHAPRSSRREVRERVLQAMHEVALPEPERRMNDYPHQFSGGQRQRVLIAMALVNKPRLLIADEPTTALDVTVQAQILALLKKLRETHGLSMLYISHDLAVVAQVADRVAVMRQGVIVEQASTADIFTRPQHEYTRTLLVAAPTMRSDRERPLATVG